MIVSSFWASWFLTVTTPISFISIMESPAISPVVCEVHNTSFRVRITRFPSSWRIAAVAPLVPADQILLSSFHIPKSPSSANPNVSFLDGELTMHDPLYVIRFALTLVAQPCDTIDPISGDNIDRNASEVGERDSEGCAKVGYFKCGIRYGVVYVGMLMENEEGETDGNELGTNNLAEFGLWVKVTLRLNAEERERDNDVLRIEGATLDGMLLGLWDRIGKLLVGSFEGWSDRGSLKSCEGVADELFPDNTNGAIVVFKEVEWGGEIDVNEKLANGLFVSIWETLRGPECGESFVIDVGIEDGLILGAGQNVRVLLSSEEGKIEGKVLGTNEVEKDEMWLVCSNEVGVLLGSGFEERKGEFLRSAGNARGMVGIDAIEVDELGLDLCERVWVLLLFKEGMTYGLLLGLLDTDESILHDAGGLLGYESKSVKGLGGSDDSVWL